MPVTTIDMDVVVLREIQYVVVYFSFVVRIATRKYGK